MTAIQVFPPEKKKIACFRSLDWLQRKTVFCRRFSLCFVVCDLWGGWRRAHLSLVWKFHWLLSSCCWKSSSLCLWFHQQYWPVLCFAGIRAKLHTFFSFGVCDQFPYCRYDVPVIGSLNCSLQVWSHDGAALRYWETELHMSVWYFDLEHKETRKV